MSVVSALKTVIHFDSIALMGEDQEAVRWRRDEIHVYCVFQLGDAQPAYAE